MATLREIKRRIRSINNTAKVTHAMELVAAAKMRKSQLATLSARPYSITLHQVLYQLEQNPKVSHKLLQENESPKEFVILVTSDRGLAGGLNINLFREVLKTELVKTAFVTVGKKALQFSVRTNQQVFASFGSEEIPFLELARTLTKIAIENFVSGQVSKVLILYPHFESATKQTPRWIQLLPIKPVPTTEIVEKDKIWDFLIEPSLTQVVDFILPHHVLTTIYQTLLEAKASEHSARMIAMKNATDSANDLIDDLTLTYNQARQEAITKEILDITTAQRALE